MPTDYNQDYNQFADLEYQNQISESFLQRWKFNPMTHPFAYAARMQVLTRLGHTTRAIQYGGLFHPRMFSAFKPFLTGTASPLTAFPTGILMSTLTSPPTIASFLVRSSLMTSLFRHGGIAGILNYSEELRPVANWVSKLSGSGMWRPGILGGQWHSGLIGPSYLKNLYSMKPQLPDFFTLKQTGIVGRFTKRKIGEFVGDLLNVKQKMNIGLRNKVFPNTYIGQWKVSVKDILTENILTSDEFIYSKKKLDSLLGRTTVKLGKKYGFKKNTILDVYKDATGFFASMKAYIAAGAQQWAATSFFENGLLPTSGTAASDLYKYLETTKLGAIWTTGQFKTLPDLIKNYNVAVKETYGNINAVLAKMGMLPGHGELKRLWLGKRGAGEHIYDILARTFSGVTQRRLGQFDARVGFIRHLRDAYFAGTGGLAGEYTIGLTNLIKGQFKQDLLYGATRRNTFLAMWEEIRAATSQKYRNDIFVRFLKHYRNLDISSLASKSDKEIGALFGFKDIKSEKAKTIIANFKASVKKNGKLSAAEAYKLASESYSEKLARTERVAFGGAFKWFIIGKIAAKAMGAAIGGAVQAAENFTSYVGRITHLDFGSGRALTTRMAATERSRAIQAIQYSGMNARSYLGYESQIYAGVQ